ncbi:MAG: Glu/Leu/Phe/Val dehydrogenase family protein, partial [Pseudomonadota bacterium]
LSPGETKTPERFSALGRVIDGLSGQYIVAEDVGSTPADMTFVRRETRHVAGTPVETGGTGDPSPTTSYGVFVGLMRTAEVALGRTSLKGVHVAVQGLGSVGYGLARYLAEAGARLTVSDINPEAVARAEAELGATPADPEAIATVEADIFSPNALGAVLSPATIPRLNVAAVVGAANNQLHADSDGEALRRRGILYAPDYVVNAGGLIQMGGELMGWSRTEVDRRVAAIADRLGRIFARAQAHGVATNKAADALAEERFSSPEVALA